MECESHRIGSPGRSIIRLNVPAPGERREQARQVRQAGLCASVVAWQACAGPFHIGRMQTVEECIGIQNTNEDIDFPRLTDSSGNPKLGNARQYPAEKPPQS